MTMRLGFSACLLSVLVLLICPVLLHAQDKSKNNAKSKDDKTKQVKAKDSNQDQAKPQTRLLWPKGAPQAVGDEDRDKPTITIYLPPKDKAVGTGVVVCPGGGYGALAMDHEGKQIAQWFNSFGVAAFVLKYRIGKRYQHPAPLQDAQRAIRTVRYDAKKYGIEPDRIGVMGFSAGGHLASTVGTHFDSGNPDSREVVQSVSCRPDFLVLCYPVISFVTDYTHKGSRRNLLGDDPDSELVEDLSNELRVTENTPPTFLFHTDQDRGVLPENSLLFYIALRKHKVPAELHIYRRGGHGLGLAKRNKATGTWPDRLKDWMEGNGWLKKPKVQAQK